MKYGVGYGTSKKQAKSDAAKATLEILIPEMSSKITADSKSSSNASKAQDQDLSVCITYIHTHTHTHNIITFDCIANVLFCYSFLMKSEWKIQEWRNFVQKLQNHHRTIYF